MEKIEELARELLKNILEKYHKRGDWDTRSLSKMIEDELKNYNEEVKYLIEAELYNILGSFYFENTNREIAVTPVLLSDMLYKNAKDVSKTATKILSEAINAKKTIGDLAKELYEGYGFREKEPIDLIDKYALPKYIKNELTRPKNIKKVMKQIEKLKTKPLRIAYKNIFRELDKMSYEGLQKALYVATQEKARYYANRIAKTEIHRASMSKWAKEMLEDDEVEFVEYRLSTAHKIKDICDFYAHLDLGYGPGIYPKREMRILPLHPFCSCVYDPYYREVKGKRKPWDKAVKETMEKFSEYEQRQILGSKEKLQEFKQGRDIEEIFNSIRPKYPIKKYIDIFKEVDYNTFMRSASKEELEEFLEIDKKILEIIKDLDEDNFKELWSSFKKYKKHINKRIKLGHVKSEKDYIEKIKDTFLNPDDVKWKKYKKNFKEKHNRFDRIFYKKGDWWVDVFLENGKIVTAFEMDRKEYREILLKGDKNTFEIIDIPLKELKDERKN